MILLALGMVAFTSSVSRAENLVQNGGFEYDMFGWDLINDLGNAVSAQDNKWVFTAIEGESHLRVQVTNPDLANSWKTSVKYPISQIMTPGEKWIFKFSVKKVSEDGQISAGLMDNRPPWDSLFWTGDIDLSTQSVGSTVEYKYEFEIPYDIWYPAFVLNLGAKIQDLIIDNVSLERKDQIFNYEKTILSGRIMDDTRYTYSKLYVVAYPEGDALIGNDVNAIIVPVNENGAAWSMEVPFGKKYTLALYSKTTAVTKRVTKPWVWSVNANVPEIGGIDFHITCNTYKSSTGWTSFADACYQ